MRHPPGAIRPCARSAASLSNATRPAFHPAPPAPEKAQNFAQGEGHAPLSCQHPAWQAHHMAAAARFQPPGIKNRKRNVEEEGGPVGHPPEPNDRNTKGTWWRLWPRENIVKGERKKERKRESKTLAAHQPGRAVVRAHPLASS